MLREIKAQEPSPYVITVTAFRLDRQAIRAVKLGAFDYITKPFEIDQLILAVEKALAIANCAPRSSACARKSRRATASTTSSASRRRCRGLRPHPAPREFQRVRCDHRESGTGQGTGRKSPSTARPRKNRPSSAVNCAAIRTRLLEASCSATSAAPSPMRATTARACSSRPTRAPSSSTRSRSCRRRCRPSSLRVLQEREIRPLAPPRDEKVDVRVVAATNKELEVGLKERHVPRGSLLPAERDPAAVAALRDRAEDIPALAEHFLASYATKAGKPLKSIAERPRKRCSATRGPATCASSRT